MSIDLRNEVYTFSDVPKKRQYLIDRLKEIYKSTSEKKIKKVLDEIKITFREQKERGASNHHELEVYLPLHDFKKFFLKNRDDVINYLNNPKSTVTHETMHIFQNLFKAIPDVKYLEKSDNGNYVIDYDKYWNDSGEKQSRLEQALELVSWGLTKSEIVQFMYNRVHDDRDLWSRIVDRAIEINNEKIKQN
jgi:hypothetical protein